MRNYTQAIASVLVASLSAGLAGQPALGDSGRNSLGKKADNGKSARIVVVRRVVNELAFLTPGAALFAFSPCDPGEVVVGGGYEVGSDPGGDLIPTLVYPTNQPVFGPDFTAWQVVFLNAGDSDLSIRAIVTALCTRGKAVEGN